MNLRSRNPGLIAQLERASRQELQVPEDLSLWGGLSLDEMKFLSYYLHYRDAKKAALELGKQLDWVFEHEANPRFAQEMAKVLDHPMRLGIQLARTAFPWTIIKLIDMIDTGTPTIQLKAITQLHGVVGVSSSEGTQVNNNRTTNYVTNMFDYGQADRTVRKELDRVLEEHEEGMIVEGQAVPIEEDAPVSE